MLREAAPLPPCKGACLQRRRRDDQRLRRPKRLQGAADRVARGRLRRAVHGFRQQGRCDSLHLCLPLLRTRRRGYPRAGEEPRTGGYATGSQGGTKRLHPHHRHLQQRPRFPGNSPRFHATPPRCCRSPSYPDTLRYKADRSHSDRPLRTGEGSCRALRRR